MIIGGLVISAPFAHGKLALAAHRGASITHPENTLPAFAASKVISDFVEFDVRVAADGEFYVLHDDRVDRTTNGSGDIASMLASQLSPLNAGIRFNGGTVHVPIPTVTEALLEIQSDAAPMMEFKSGSVDQAVALLRRVPWRSDGVVTSFNRDWLAELKQRRPDVRMGWLGSGALTTDNVDRAVRDNIRLISWRYTELTPEIIDYMHARGVVVYAWTINDPAGWRQVAQMGVDGIVTAAAELADAVGLFDGPAVEIDGPEQAEEDLAATAQRLLVLDSGAVARTRRNVVWRRESDNSVVGRSGTLLVPAGDVTPRMTYRAEWVGRDGKLRQRAFRLAETDRDGGLVNLSARVAVGVGERTPVVGWVTSGSQPDNYLLRGVGPSLGAFGISDPVKAPRVKLFSAGHNETLISAHTVQSLARDDFTARVGAFPLSPGLGDASEVSLLSAGAHTVHLSSDDGHEGTGLLEVYRDMRSQGLESSRLMNLSFRGWVPARGNLVAGFVVDGPASQLVLIRGVGPGLRRFGVKQPMMDPWIRLVDQYQRVLAVSDDWSNDDDSGLVRRALVHTGSPELMAEGGRDAAMLLNLRPGAYTVILESVDSAGTGIALLELFHLDDIPAEEIASIAHP